MFEHFIRYFPLSSITGFVFFLVSLFFCSYLMIKPTNLKIRNICKISILFPGLLGLLKTFWGMYLIFGNISMMNDFSPSIIADGYLTTVHAAIFGLAEVLILLILYSITIVINNK